MTKLLVANRGEVAVRIFRTARRMGMRCIAVYSDADEGSPFVREADEAIRIGTAPAEDSYLRIDRVIDAARESGADLIHPGYGFLAEDPELAAACEGAGIGFVGPPAPVLAALGSKDEAKRLAIEAGVPVLEGYSGDEQSDAAFAEAAEKVGYPVIIKPVAGGGGKGMAVVASKTGLAAALASARRAGKAAFGDDRLLLERYVTAPRHIEIQVLADHHGNVVHLGERDCSLQRRHQKILEESPSPAVDGSLRTALSSHALALATRAGYRNAGTCEFIVSADGTVAFLEMNARLQVEHPVTEVVTGVDLVELQLRVAMGERLPIEQSDVKFSGHAIEVRVYAEDPDNSFLPQAGVIEHVRWPEGVRVDTGVFEGSEVTHRYDPMIAKVIVGGENRDQAMQKMRLALDEIEILGLRSNVPFLRWVIDTDEVREGNVTTTWLETKLGDLPMEPTHLPAEVVAMAAAAEADCAARPRGADPWDRLGTWRLGSKGSVPVVVRTDEGETLVQVAGTGPFLVGSDRVERADGCHAWTFNGEPAAVAGSAGAWFVWWRGRQYEVVTGAAERRADAGGRSHLEAPMPGQILEVKVSSGEKVRKGQELVVMEAMKMEHAITAPADGVVESVLCAVGDQVDRGRTLVEFEPA